MHLWAGSSTKAGYQGTYIALPRQSNGLKNRELPSPENRMCSTKNTWVFTILHKKLSVM